MPLLERPISVAPTIEVAKLIGDRHRNNSSHWRHSHDFAAVSSQVDRRTRIVIVITALMMIVELATGAAFNSMALLAGKYFGGSWMDPGWELLATWWWGDWRLDLCGIPAGFYWIGRRSRRTSRMKSAGQSKVTETRWWSICISGRLPRVHVANLGDHVADARAPHDDIQNDQVPLLLRRQRQHSGEISCPARGQLAQSFGQNVHQPPRRTTS